MTTTSVTYRRVDLAVFDAEPLRTARFEILPRRAHVTIPEVKGAGSPRIAVDGPVIDRTSTGPLDILDTWRTVTVVVHSYGQPDLALADAPQWVRDVWAEHVPAAAVAGSSS